MIALSSKERFEYVLNRDRESDSPTIWILKPLTIAETEECENLLSSAGAGIRIGTFKKKVVKLGLVGWENLKYDTGEAVELKLDKQGKVHDEILALIPPDDRSELHTAIWEQIRVSEDDEKNSS
jgi:hypothetical protein